MKLAQKIFMLVPASVSWRLGAFLERGLRGLMYFSGYRLRSLEPLHRHISITRERSEFLNDPNSVLVLTMTRSGTHWISYLIGNYIAQVSENQLLLNMNNEELRAAIFSNPRNGLLWLGVDSSPGITEKLDLPCKNFFFQHMISGKNNSIFFEGRRILLYRNPRDWVVSVHHYLSDREDLIYRPRNYRDAINFIMPEFCESMKCIRALQKCDKDLILSYEELVDNSADALERIVRFLDLPIDEKAIEFSIDKSSAKKTREQGARIGTMKPEKFVRDARVGQWRTQLNDKHLKLIDSYLHRNDIDIDQFRYAL